MKRMSVLEQPEGTNTVRVLLVGDTVEELDPLAESLDVLEGVQVVGVALDGIQAVGVARALLPDVVVMDIRWSVDSVDGIQATHEITARHPNIAVLVHSATNDESTVAETLAAGARGYLLKPSTAEEIAEAVVALAHGEYRFAPEVSGPLLNRLATSFREQRAHRIRHETLQQVEAKFRTLVEQIPAITYTETVDTQETQFISPQMQSILGYTEREWLEDPHLWERIIHPEDRDRVVGECTLSNREQKPFRSEYRMVARDGRVIWFKDEALLVRNDDGTALCWQGVMIDITESKRSEQALQELEAKFRRLVEQIPAVVYMAEVGDDGDWLYVSPQIERLLGYSPDEWLALPAPFAIHLHPQDKPRVLAEEARCAATGEPWRAEYRMRDRNGRTVWIRDEAVIVRDHRDTPPFWQGVMIDITESKRSEEERGRLIAVAESERRLREMLEKVQLAAVELDASGHVSFCNAYLLRLTGWTEEDVLGRDWFDSFVPPELEDARHRFLQDVAAGVIQPHHESPILTRSGYRRRVVWSNTLTRDADGEVVGLTSIGQDVTDQREAERRLRDAEARYRTLVEQIPAATYTDAVSSTLEDMTPLYVSPQIESILGIPSEEFVSEDLWEASVHPDDRGRAVQETMRGVAGGEPFTMEYRMVARDGRVVWIREQSSVLHDEDGQPTMVHGVLFDITDLKRAQEDLETALGIEREAAERLRQADEMKTAFLTAVSHELRTPLTAILGTASTLEREEELAISAEDRRDLIRGLASKSRRLNELLVDLLDVERLARGAVQSRRRPTDVGALVRRMVQESDLLTERAVHVQASETVVDVDAPMVERIVENLLANAFRHTPPETSVWVRVTREERGALIAVEDDGPGVPPELRESIFEPFRQGADVRAHSPGVGIGLSLVARFAELHSGSAWVEERAGGGASFRVFLPELPQTKAAARTAGPS